MDNTFEVCDKKDGGKISFEEYCEYCRLNPRVLQPFSVDIKSLIEYESDQRKQERIGGKTRELHHGALFEDESDGHFSKLKKRLAPVKVKATKLKKEKYIHVLEVESSDQIVVTPSASISFSDDYFLPMPVTPQSEIRSRSSEGEMESGEKGKSVKRKLKFGFRSTKGRDKSHSIV